MSCVIPGCQNPVDRHERVEMAIPGPPYKELRAACPEHLERFRAIGLPVRKAAS